MPGGPPPQSQYPWQGQPPQQPPGGPPQFQYPWQGQPQPPKKKHTARNVILAVCGGVVGLFIVIAIIGAALGSGKTRGSSSAASSPATVPSYSSIAETPGAQAPPTPTPTPTGPVIVHISVKGTGDPSVQYGSDSNNISPPGGYGPLGDGVATPFHASLQFDPSALYYSITAQLEGSGNITCKIWISAPGYQNLTIATGHAQGSYNICSAQVAPGDTSGLNWSKE